MNVILFIDKPAGLNVYPGGLALQKIERHGYTSFDLCIVGTGLKRANIGSSRLHLIPGTREGSGRRSKTSWGGLSLPILRPLLFQLRHTRQRLHPSANTRRNLLSLRLLRRAILSLNLLKFRRQSFVVSSSLRRPSHQNYTLFHHSSSNNQST